MKLQNIAFVCVLAYLWAAILLFGANLYETFIFYPNIFRDIPRSFEIGKEFLAVAGPADFFRPLGMAIMLAGILSVALVWPVKSARYWIMASALIVILGEYVFSASFFWPRNTIMFTEGTARHSVEFLKQTAQEFQTWHWVRLGLNGVFSALAFVGLLKLYRARSMSQQLSVPERPAAPSPHEQLEASNR
jgi:hypothetical protein